MSGEYTIVTRPGQVDLDGGTYTKDNALFRTQFLGEVLTQFRNTTLMGTADMQLIRSITSGKSADIPVVGRTTGYYHTPGDQLIGAEIAHNQKNIAIDDLLVAPIWLYKLDEMKEHFDLRQIYAGEIGDALAQTFDKQCLRVITLGARTAATISGEAGGARIVAAAGSTDPETLLQMLRAAKTKMSKNKVPLKDRHCVLPPDQYDMLVEYMTVTLNKNRGGGTGSLSEGEVPRLYGFQIHESNNLPNTDESAVSGTRNTYDGDFTTTIGICFHRSAMGTVKLMDLMTSADWVPMYKSTLLCGEMAVGHGLLRPEACIELATGAVS